MSFSEVLSPGYIGFAKSCEVDPSEDVSTASKNPCTDQPMHAVLTCFAVLRYALSLSSRVNRNHSYSVDSVRLQVLQHSVVGAA